MRVCQFKFYLHQALAKAGLGDDYLMSLDKWREYMANGLTTWGETSDVNTTRSDCHAWGASPNIEFFRILLGIDSSDVAFRKVMILPNLGSIQRIGGTMPHPQGEIKVSYFRKGDSLNAEIVLPEKVSGTFVWAGRQYDLHGGLNTLTVR